MLVIVSSPMHAWKSERARGCGLRLLADVPVHGCSPSLSVFPSHSSAGFRLSLAHALFRVLSRAISHALSLSRSVCLSVCLSFCLHVCLPVHLPACLSVCLSAHPPLPLPLPLSLSLSFALSPLAPLRENTHHVFAR